MIRERLPRKANGRYRGQFCGDDDGYWVFYSEIELTALQRYDWTITLGSRRKEAYVANATEYNRGFRTAFPEMVAQYPELLDFSISFDGPPIPAQELLDSDGELHFIHGTSTALLDQILTDGLCPRNVTGLSPVYGGAVGALEGRSDAVYLTTQIGMASFAAGDAVRKFGGEKAIINILRLDTNLLAPDEDSRESTVEGSIDRMGSVAYVGSIPPEDLVVDWSAK